MRTSLLLPRRVLTDGRAAPCREGRDSEVCRHVTALVLFPRADARPGMWLVLLASVCTYVAVRALELGVF